MSTNLFAVVIITHVIFVLVSERMRFNIVVLYNWKFLFQESNKNMPLYFKKSYPDKTPDVPVY